MNTTTLIGLLNNVALLLTLGLLYDALMTNKKARTSNLREVLSGAILGAIGIAVMMNPWHWTEGVIFDTRSVLLSVSGLGFGVIPTAIAMITTASYRSYLGGAGVWMGIAVILCSGMAGILWRHLLRKELGRVSLGEWYLMGLTVHIIMVLCMFLLPRPIVWTTMVRVGIPALLIFPVGTALLGKVMSARDARLRAEEIARDQSARLASLSANVPGVVYEFMVHPDGAKSFQYVSDGCRSLLGLEPAEVLRDPESVLDLVHPDERPALEANLAAVIQAKSPWQWEGRCIVKGKIKWIQGASTPQLLSDGSAVWGGILSDVTGLKVAEEERELLQSQLFQSQKIESIGRLAGGVAHDFNNMLSVILGQSEFALDQLDPNNELHQNLQEIHKAAQRSADLTRQLLSFARKQTINPVVLDLNETIDGMLNLLRRLIGENIDLKWTPASNLWRVKIDRSQFDQILANLVVNARDAIRGAGDILLETDNITLDELYCFGRMESIPGDFVQILINDSGSGMSKEIQERLFEPYFTTKELGRGTGLGLATVYGIVKQNQGFINVYSEENKGTSIRVFLPRFDGPVAESLNPTPAHESIAGTETLLIVEDEEAILTLIQKRLENLGYTILTARTPQEAISLVSTFKNKIHLLLTDIILPEMNGRELSKKLKLFQPQMSCLFMSGYSSNVISSQDILQDGIHLIQKPFSLKVLTQKIRELIS
jgi:signal transduction histidine kinase